MCVFTWGLQYKLSLYDPPQAVSHQIPQAKLLSRDQQSYVRQSPILQSETGSDKATIALFSLLFFLVLLDAPWRLAQPRRSLDRNAPVRSPNHANVASLFFRPPPVLC